MIIIKPPDIWRTEIDSLRKSVVAGALQAVGNINNKKEYLQKINSLSNKINIKVNNYNG